jgi:hypothetical protein
VTASTVSKPTPPWNRPAHAQWRHLAARLKAWGDCLTERRDVRVSIAPASSSAAPAGVFNHRTMTITLDAMQTLPGKPDPARIDLRDGQDRALHPVLAGVLAHEVGHATHTRLLGSLPPDVAEWAALLEEPRMEGLVVSGCSEARQWLRASAAHILGTPEPKDPETAARVLILFGGRALAGVLDVDDLPDLDTLLGEWLTAQQVSVIGLETARAVAAADEDTATLINAARRIASVLPQDSESDTPDDSDDDSAAHRHGGDNNLDPDGELADALGKIADAATQELRQTAGIPSSSPAAQARREAAAARRTEIADNHRAARESAHHLEPRRATPEELVACRDLQRRLRTAKARDVVVTRVDSLSPPGRLRTAQLVRRAGQVDARVAPTATPWSMVRRRTVDSPQLVLGLALDISVSMSEYAGPTALAQWMFARAVRQLGGNTATVTWNHSVSLMPANTSAAVQVPTIGGSSTGLPSALRVLTRELTLHKPCGARMVAIVTDADLPNPDEVGKEVALLIAHGVRVLWLTSPDVRKRAMRAPAGVSATVLHDPGRIGQILGDAAVRALSA